MSRELFADWASGLSDDDFACALAAAGVVDAEGLLRVRNGVSRWREAKALDPARSKARALAKTWKTFIAKYPELRLTIMPPWSKLDPDWLIQQFSRPGLGIASASLSLGRWPATGLLRQPRISLMGDVNQQSPYDILIIPQGMSAAAALGRGMKANAVVTVGGMPKDPKETVHRLQALAESLGASAAAAVGLESKAQAGWFAKLRAGLLRGVAFDLALWRSLQTLPKGTRFLLMENERWLEQDAALTDFKPPIRQGIHPPVHRPIVHEVPHEALPAPPPGSEFYEWAGERVEPQGVRAS